MKKIILKIGGKSLLKKGESINEGVIRVSNIIRDISDVYDKVVVVLSALGNETDDLYETLNDISATPDKQMADLLLSIGEQKAIALVGAGLKELDVNVIALTGWQSDIRTNGFHTSASIINIKTSTIEGHFANHDVLLIAGFQGVTVDDKITTLGRGGSDTTAVALGYMSDIKECVFLKDVDGVFTCDPKSDLREQLLPNVSYDMLLEVASSGAEIVNTRAAELAKTYNYPITVKCIDNVKGDGSTINCDPVLDTFVLVENDKANLINIYGVDNKPGRVSPILKIIKNHILKVVYLNQSFSTGDKATLSILLWSNSEETIAKICTEIKLLDSVERAVQKTDVCSVSIVSDNMLSGVGVVKSLLQGILSKNVSIYGISTSPTRITFVVPLKDKNSISMAIYSILRGSTSGNI